MGTEAGITQVRVAEAGIAEAGIGTLPSLAPKALTVVGADGKVRPSWVGTDKLLVDYYDLEWGDPIVDEQAMFELLSLLAFQAGLRWRSILRRRADLKKALAGFDPDELATWGPEQLEALVENPKVIRNRRKLSAILQNATATVRLRSQGGLVAVIWEHQPDACPEFSPSGELPDSTEESARLAKTLKEHGFSAVGPKSCFALMQSAGVVDTNPPNAFKRGSSGLWDQDGNRVRSPLETPLAS